MAENKIICEKNSVDYLSIRKAMCRGARTLSEIKTEAHVCGSCSGCKEHLTWILASVCGCKNVSLESVVQSVKRGAKTVEEVGKDTEAGTDCGRCASLIENIIQWKR